MLSALSDISAKSLGYKASLVASGFTGELITPSDPDYEASLARFSKSAQKPAAVVAYVKTAEDVSRVIQFATKNSVEIVVKGGGHNIAGSSSTNGGVVIDLSRHFKYVRVDTENKLGYVGGGATWADVDAEAIKYGLAAVAGTVNYTGVGGLSLGGGYGWLTGEHGMVIDNIVQHTVVTPGGQILTVTADSYPDLFWALRGGGTNFGCVTEFVYRLHPQSPTVFAGPLEFPPPLLPKLVEALEDWHSTASEKEGAMLVNATKGKTGVPDVVLLVFFNGDEEEGRRRFKKVLDVGPVVDMAGMIPYEQLNALQNPSIHIGCNDTITCLTRETLSPSAASSIFDKMVLTANSLTSKVENAVIAIFWEYYNLKKQSSVAPDATAYRMRYPFGLSALIITWTGEGEEGEKEARLRLEDVETFANELLDKTYQGGKRHPDATGYGNYEAHGSLTPGSAEKLFTGNYLRLREIKKKYDPEMTFKNWYAIQPID